MLEARIIRPPLSFFGIREITSNATVFTIRIEDTLMMAENTDRFDYGLLKECENSDAIADKLLALENIVRRIERALGVEQP